MVADQQSHRPGPLKQANKTHKTGRHRSKGAIDKALKGDYFEINIFDSIDLCIFNIRQSITCCCNSQAQTTTET